MLTGTFEDFSLPDIFRLISSAERTGRIDVARSGGSGSVYFTAGEVSYAESSLTQGLASGNVHGKDLEAALKSQIEGAVFDLLRWKEGDFRWESGAEFDTSAELSLSVDDLVAEAARKLEELEVISTKIPSEAAVLVMAPAPPDDAAEINITPEEWRALVLVNGVRPVTEIAALAGMDTFSVLRVLYGLCDHGLIAVAESDAVEAEPSEPSGEDLRSEATEGGRAEESEELEEKGSGKTDTAEAEFAPVGDEAATEISAEAIEATLPDPAVDRTAAVRELAGLFDHADG